MVLVCVCVCVCVCGGGGGGGGGLKLWNMHFLGVNFYLLGEMGGGVIFHTITHPYAEFSLPFKPLKGLNFQIFFPREHAPGPP